MGRILDLFLSSEATLGVEKSGNPTKRDLQVYAASVLVHGALADAVIGPKELLALVSRVAMQFQLSEAEAARVIELGDVLRRQKRSVDDFVRALNGRFEKSQKITFMAMLWSVMRADGLFSEIEARFAADIATQLNLNAADIEQARAQSESGARSRHH